MVPRLEGLLGAQGGLSRGGEVGWTPGESGLSCSRDLALGFSICVAGDSQLPLSEKHGCSVSEDASPGFSHQKARPGSSCRRAAEGRGRVGKAGWEEARAKESRPRVGGAFICS